MESGVRSCFLAAMVMPQLSNVLKDLVCTWAPSGSTIAFHQNEAMATWAPRASGLETGYSYTGESDEATGPLWQLRKTIGRCVAVATLYQLRATTTVAEATVTAATQVDRTMNRMLPPMWDSAARKRTLMYRAVGTIGTMGLGALLTPMMFVIRREATMMMRRGSCRWSYWGEGSLCAADTYDVSNSEGSDYDDETW